MTLTEHAWHDFARELRAYIAGRVAQPDAVDDIVQTVFERLHRTALDDPPSSVRGWLYQVARNAIADHYRHHGRLVRSDDEAEPAVPPAAEAPAADAYAALQPCLNGLLGQLPDDDRAALVAVDARGLSQTELARSLGLSPSGAKSRVQRARRKLRELIASCCALELSRRGRLVDVDMPDDCEGCGTDGNKSVS